jgi:hypothetical protein
MLASVRAFLEGIIDYAGLFPPAKLDLPHALHNYVEYLTGPDAWMLGRFVCPVPQLTEALRTLAGLKLATNVKPRFSLIPRTATQSEELLQNLQENLSVLAAAQTLTDGKVGDVWEIRLPPDVMGEPHLPNLWQLVEDIGDAVSPTGAKTVFFEASAAPVEGFAAMIRRLRSDEGHVGKIRVGFKLRTGGLEESAIPPPHSVAEVIVNCRESKIPLKFTAGLHHPLRQFDPNLGAHTHGFLNVFGAALLAHAHELNPEQLLPILLEEDPHSFVFAETEFGWKDYRMDLVLTKNLRESNVVSFGSCSFEEPRDDLSSLSLLS